MKLRTPKPAGFAGILTLTLIEVHRGGRGGDNKQNSDIAGERK
jgi:hypothetical protein